MRRLIALAVIVAACAGLAGTTPAAAAPEAPAAVEATGKAAAIPSAYDICRVIQVATPLPGTGIYKVGYLSFFGLTYVRCCYYNLRTGQRIMALYLVGWGDLSYPQNDPWCR